jgi:hypothetical protein
MNPLRSLCALFAFCLAAGVAPASAAPAADTDGGTTWETNWVMDLTRAGAL